MKETEFNLLDEKWIRVRLPDNSIQEVSLTDVLLHAQDYADLAGEMPTQDAAMLRLLLAVPLTIFYRVNVRGEEEPLVKSDQAIMRWKELWELGAFPEKPIRDYLEKWHERFWLFHPERPFWQVKEANIGTSYGAAKLNGEISESTNKVRLFCLYSGEEKNSLNYSQAARWLLYVNGYDDTSAKPKGKNLPSVGAGWLGKIGFIQAQGQNLFETLMLKLILLQDGKNLWEENLPYWELDNPRTHERVEIALPRGYAQLLTLQSRRILLERNGNGHVIQYSLLGGDFFQKENAFTEQMTIWRSVKAKKDAPVEYVPCRHDPAKQFWREFPTVFCDSTANVHKPGVVRWITLLQNKRLKILNPKTQIHFRISGAQYGDKDFFVNDSFWDTLSFQISILDEFNVEIRTHISNEIERCEKTASLLGHYAQELAIAAGKSTNQDVESIKTRFYFNIDVPFRQWLWSIDTEQKSIDEKLLEWQKTCYKITMDMAKEIIRNVNISALVGRKVQKEEKGNPERAILYTAPKAYNEFQRKLWRIYPMNNLEGGR